MFMWAQRLLKLSMCFSLKHFFMSVRIPKEVASAPLTVLELAKPVMVNILPCILVLLAL